MLDQEEIKDIRNMLGRLIEEATRRQPFESSDISVPVSTVVKLLLIIEYQTGVVLDLNKQLMDGRLGKVKLSRKSVK